MAMTNIIIALNNKIACKGLMQALVSVRNLGVLTTTSGGNETICRVRQLGGSGVIICSIQMEDMHFSKLLNAVPTSYKLLVLQKQRASFSINNERVAVLAIPLNKSSLIATIETLALSKVIKEELIAPKDTLNKAKFILMRRNLMTEPQAHRFIQKKSMDIRSDIYQVANSIININERL